MSDFYKTMQTVIIRSSTTENTNINDLKKYDDLSDAHKNQLIKVTQSIKKILYCVTYGQHKTLEKYSDMTDKAIQKLHDIISDRVDNIFGAFKDHLMSINIMMSPRAVLKLTITAYCEYIMASVFLNSEYDKPLIFPDTWPE